MNDWDAAMQVVRYLHGTLNDGIVYSTSDSDLHRCTDADFMGETGYIFPYDKCVPISQALESRTFNKPNTFSGDRLLLVDFLSACSCNSVTFLVTDPSN